MRKTLHMLFYSVVLFISFFLMIASFIFAEHSSGDWMFGFVPALVFGLFAWHQITVFDRRKLLRFKKVPIIKPHYALFLTVSFLAVCVLSSFAAYFAYQSLTEGTGRAEPLLIALYIFTIIIGTLLLWLLIANTVFIGIRNYLKSLFGFLRDRVSVFLLYQLFFMLISGICSSLVSLAEHNADSSQLMLSGFMMSYAAGDTVPLLNVAPFFSSLTAASSYFVLSNLALEHLSGEGNEPFVTRIKRMFFDTDTLTLLSMTLLNILFLIVPGLLSERAILFVMLALMALWGLSFYALLSHTNLILFFLNYSVMTLIETAVPTPAFTGISPVLLAILTFVFKLFLFSVVALHIGYMYASQQAAQDENTDEPSADTAFDPSVLSQGVVIAGIFVNRKDEAKAKFDAFIKKFTK